jgi:hypothetical protein
VKETYGMTKNQMVQQGTEKHLEGRKELARNQNGKNVRRKK